MRLSEAIRLGGVLSSGQIKGKLYEASTNRSCAIGGAYQAIGYDMAFMDTVYLTKMAKTQEGRVELSIQEEARRELVAAHGWTDIEIGHAIHLNDLESMTREQIADELDKMFPAPVVESTPRGASNSETEVGVLAGVPSK